MKGTPALETRRLALRPLDISDAGQIQELFPHWDIVRLLSARVPWPYPADGALTFIRDVVLPAVERGTAWHWSIRLRTIPDRLIGAISLMDEPDNNRGFLLAPGWQRQRLMTEATSVVTKFWFETLDKPVLRVPKAGGNLPSRLISEREGMHVVRIEERDFVSGRSIAEIWEISREAWRLRQGMVDEHPVESWCPGRFSRSAPTDPSG